jgi:hypothetical protein
VTGVVVRRGVWSPLEAGAALDLLPVDEGEGGQAPGNVTCWVADPEVLVGILASQDVLVWVPRGAGSSGQVHGMVDGPGLPRGWAGFVQKLAQVLGMVNGPGLPRGRTEFFVQKL